MGKILLPFILIFFSSALLADVSNCADSWKGELNNGRYDFSKDAVYTENGNVGYSSYEKSLKRKDCMKEWTVLVYMAADNDLSAYAYWDLHEMETKVENQLNLGASTDTVDVVVELDTLKRDGVKRLHMFQRDDQFDNSLTFDDFDKSRPSFVKSPIVEIFSEDSGVSVESRFQRFLAWGIQKYPSKHYMIVVWGHGEGFIGQTKSHGIEVEPLGATAPSSSSLFKLQDFSLESFSSLPDAQVFPVAKTFGGVAFDHSDKSYLGIPQIREILSELSNSFLDGEKFDILAFDACLMQSLEVMTELKEEADFLIGSNQIQNYLGMPYRLILDYMNQGVEPRELARELPLMTKASWKKGGYQALADKSGFETFTMSTLSSWHLKEVVLPELEEFSETLLSYLDEDQTRRQELMFLIENAPRFQGEMIDLGLFYGLVEKMLWLEKLSGKETLYAKKLKDHLVKATNGIGQTVLEATFGPLYYDSSLSQGEGSYMLGFFKGFSVWLPKTPRLYDLRAAEMSKSQLHQNVSSWNRVLKELYTVNNFVFDLGGL